MLFQKSVLHQAILVEHPSITNCSSFITSNNKTPELPVSEVNVVCVPPAFISWQQYILYYISLSLYL